MRGWKYGRGREEGKATQTVESRGGREEWRKGGREEGRKRGQEGRVKRGEKGRQEGVSEERRKRERRRRRERVFLAIYTKVSEGHKGWLVHMV
jgi:hypothetical protein